MPAHAHNNQINHTYAILWALSPHSTLHTESTKTRCIVARILLHMHSCLHAHVQTMLGLETWHLCTQAHKPHRSTQTTHKPHTHTHTYTHTYTHTHTHTHTHTCRHTHTMLSFSLIWRGAGNIYKNNCSWDGVLLRFMSTEKAVESRQIDREVNIAAPLEVNER